VSVEVLKQLSRGTKGNSVKERHSMPSTKNVVFAEQLQVSPCPVACSVSSYLSCC
jgi:hypothetical protein